MNGVLFQPFRLHDLVVPNRLEDLHPPSGLHSRWNRGMIRSSAKRKMKQGPSQSGSSSGPLHPPTRLTL